MAQTPALERTARQAAEQLQEQVRRRVEQTLERETRRIPDRAMERTRPEADVNCRFSLPRSMLRRVLRCCRRKSRWERWRIPQSERLRFPHCWI